MDLEEIDTVEPFIINKNLGKHLDPEKTLTQTNAEGLPAVKLSQEEKYLFDIKMLLSIALYPFVHTHTTPGLRSMHL